MKINTDAQKIKDLLERGVQNIYPTREFLEKQLKSGQRLTLYTGYDPTAPTLHIGNAITMLKLRQFQELGHRVIMLIGDFTGLIGDPTDKTAARKQQTRAEVLANCANWKKQAATILNFTGDNPVEIKYNSAWLSKLSFADVLELSSHFTVQRMLERDMFEKRMQEEKPIYVHEFMYPIMQGYDSVAMDVDGEIGGNDQTFNMLTGRDLMKDLKNKEKFVLTIKLLADTSGKKMGKSEGNMITLVDSSADMFGKIMSWTDGMILNGFELCTTIPMDEVNKIMQANTNPRDLKMRLAKEIVTLYHSAKAANTAQEYFIKTFSQKEIPQELPTIKPVSYELDAVLVQAGIVATKSMVRRVVEQQGVKVNQKIVSDIKIKLKKGDIVQKGKRFFVKVV